MSGKHVATRAVISARDRGLLARRPSGMQLMRALYADEAVDADIVEEAETHPDALIVVVLTPISAPMWGVTWPRLSGGGQRVLTIDGWETIGGHADDAAVRHLRARDGRVIARRRAGRGRWVVEGGGGR